MDLVVVVVETLIVAAVLQVGSCWQEKDKENSVEATAARKLIPHLIRNTVLVTLFACIFILSIVRFLSPVSLNIHENV